MNSNTSMDSTAETTRLLSELDLAIDHSSAMRDIISKYEHMRSIESITGPSQITRIMRKEIQILESRLRLVRSGQDLVRDSAFSPGCYPPAL